MKIALLGLPQSGKRTLFTLLTGREVTEFRKAGEAIEGRATVYDPRVDAIAKIEKPAKITFAQTEVVLCPDIEPGTGDYTWLQEARFGDLICLVVRDFESEEVYHPEGSVDAVRDRSMLDAELLLADLDLVEKRIERIEKDKKRKKPTPAQQMEEKVVLRCRDILEANQRLSTLDLTAEEEASIRSLSFITRKPLLWCYNVDESRASETPRSDGDPEFYISAQIEKEIQSMADAGERAEYLGELNLAESGVDRLNATAYDRLGLMSFYTMGKDEVRAWTIHKGSCAPTAGGKIHSDIERGFIRVEVIKYDDLIREGSEVAAKAAGKAQLKGKTYVMEDGDICHFRFNV
ncbi:MAG: DUF933 domain-containing protein [Planctomycetota bacterium]